MKSINVTHNGAWKTQDYMSSKWQDLGHGVPGSDNVATYFLHVMSGRHCSHLLPHLHSCCLSLQVGSNVGEHQDMVPLGIMLHGA